MSETNDRREYFRVDDAIRLTVHRVAAADVEERIRRLDQSVDANFTVMSSLAAISSEMAVSMRRIESREPDIAAYLRAIDRKIEVIGRAFIAQDSELMGERACPVNISAGGMGLDVREHYEPGETVELKMLLFPTFTGVLTFAQVISCQPLSAGDQRHDLRYHMRVEFTHMREQDRDILIRHVLRCQSQELRERNRENLE